MRKRTFDGNKFTGKVDDFDAPTQLPADDEQARRWQAANKDWWENAPMRYDWRDEIGANPGEETYFDEIDKRFFASVSHYMPWTSIPFDNLIDFPNLTDKAVLEIGVGHGSHAQLIASHCRKFTGIDLTHTAADMTTQRLSLKGLQGDVRQMDAEHMDFADEEFDLVWSWGVIHHSSNTQQILREIARVLRPGGEAIVMVYHRSPWKYYIMDGFIKGIFLGEYFKSKSLHKVSQQQTDGAIARYYTIPEWKAVCEGLLEVKNVKITGHKTDVIPLPSGTAKSQLERRLPDRLTRLLTNQFRFGSFLIARLGKRARAQ